MTRLLMMSLALSLAACARDTPQEDAVLNDAVSNDAIADLLAGDDEADGATGDEGDAAPPAETPSESGRNEADDGGSEQPSPPDTPEAGMIPGQYRGRWGMVEADCDQARSDTKGLLTIGERTMRFYESQARLVERRPAIATSFAGLFAFTGEGQEWSRVVTLTRDGDRLTRADEDGRFTYRRCPAASARR